MNFYFLKVTEGIARHIFLKLSYSKCSKYEEIWVFEIIPGIDWNREWVASISLTNKLFYLSSLEHRIIIFSV